MCVCVRVYKCVFVGACVRMHVCECVCVCVREKDRESRCCRAVATVLLRFSKSLYLFDLLHFYYISVLSLSCQLGQLGILI